jgi:hypothetical protein
MIGKKLKTLTVEKKEMPMVKSKAVLLLSKKS